GPSLDEVIMWFLSKIASSAGFTNRAAGRPWVATRSLVDTSTAVGLFKRMPAAVSKSVWEYYQFQKFGECDRNAMRICEPIVRYLVKQGVLEQTQDASSEPTGWFHTLWSIPKTTTTH